MDGVSLDLEPGHFYLLSGPSGGGKSTLLGLLNGTLIQEGEDQQENFRGTLCLGGEALVQQASKRARRIGSVLQNADLQILFPQVEDELAFALENLALPQETLHKRVPEMASALALSLDHRTEVMSGGEKQRLLTHATLGMGQRLVLLDEPLASLDRPRAQALLTQLKDWVTQYGYTVVFVEHRIDWVLPYADRFFWLEGGAVQSFDEGEAFSNFLNERIQAQLGAHSLQTLNQSALSGRPCVELYSVGLQFKGAQTPIFEDLSWKIEPGSRTVLLGENGAGKTTLLHLLAGLIRPTSGEVIYPWKRRERFRHLGLVMQDPGYQLFLSTVREELALQGNDPKWVSDLIELFHLESLLDRHPQSLSEGQKRRLGFAAILSMEPELLLLDEPTVGQDLVSLRAMLQALTVYLQRKPAALVTLTHDTRCGHFFGEQIRILDQGRLWTGEERPDLVARLGSAPFAC